MVTVEYYKLEAWTRLLFVDWFICGVIEWTPSPLEDIEEASSSPFARLRNPNEMNSRGASIPGPNHPLRLLNSASYLRVTHARDFHRRAHVGGDTRSEIWGFSKLGDIIAAVRHRELLTREVPPKLEGCWVGGEGSDTFDEYSQRAQKFDYAVTAHYQRWLWHHN